jgi:hypothetical protein
MANLVAKNISFLKNAIYVKSINAQAELESKINHLKNEFDFAEKCSKHLEIILPVLYNAISNFGLGIAELTHNTNNGTLNISVTAVPTSEKFKFVKDSLNNVNRLTKKAELMEDKLCETTQIAGVHVNKFSLGDETQTVLISFTVPVHNLS